MPRRAIATDAKSPWIPAESQTRQRREEWGEREPPRRAAIEQRTAPIATPAPTLTSETMLRSGGAAPTAERSPTGAERPAAERRDKGATDAQRPACGAKRSRVTSRRRGTRKGGGVPTKKGVFGRSSFFADNLSEFVTAKFAGRKSPTRAPHKYEDATLRGPPAEPARPRGQQPQTTKRATRHQAPPNTNPGTVGPRECAAAGIRSGARGGRGRRRRCGVTWFG